ncbi:hypothetical protein A6R68_14358, partial [Neotoma lepida]
MSRASLSKALGIESMPDIVHPNDKRARDRKITLFKAVSPDLLDVILFALPHLPIWIGALSLEIMKLSIQRDSLDFKRRSQDIAAMMRAEESVSDDLIDEVTKNTILNAMPLKSEAHKFFNTALEESSN